MFDYNLKEISVVVIAAIVSAITTIAINLYLSSILGVYE